ncbi:MAG: zf-HC2 domain-containing protein, partial [Fimbriimonadales bacterium]
MWRYLDKTLPAPVSRQVEAHLAVCIPCRAAFAQAQEALEALRAGKPLTPEQQRLLKRSGGAPVLKRAFVVAVLALLVGVGAYLWQIPSDALFTRLTERGFAPTPVSEQPNTLPAATQPMDDAGAIAKFKLEPLNIEEALRPAPPPTETPTPTPLPPTPTSTDLDAPGVILYVYNGDSIIAQEVDGSSSSLVMTFGVGVPLTDLAPSPDQQVIAFVGPGGGAAR